ncbi:putative ATPase [Variovorax boronicumulans]|uniref:ATPase n=1 Tax=Variovorax boronicumulans TaxID=436515 RepID=A0AAW8D2U2_9BURK|nr:DUF4435 domain-containing protein [Variovorax boronicumulans]MDP9896890.1 putative ATPase [Variovorax boronicumulans]MDQ0057013.1 putative ATPase [Variovorax boronicumulans]
MSTSIEKITLPKGSGVVEVFAPNGVIVIVGANGSGKTRLGAWIETSSTSPHQANTHRVTAQRALDFPESTTSQAINLAEEELLVGYKGANKVAPSAIGGMKAGIKFNNKPSTAFVSDYHKLVSFLFSEQIESNAKFVAASHKDSSERPPKTKLETVKEIWEKVLPHRELILGGLRVEAKARSGTERYNASEMSDGERVIFYLLGHALAAPVDGIFIVDEPENHIHKAVQIQLWQEIFKVRSDLFFILLTHDVDFAGAQIGSKKIYLKSYENNQWDWEEIESSELPEDLLLEVLGSRRPIAFVEGESGKLDATLYGELLPDFLVIPRGGCSQVIQATKAFRNNHQLHHLTVIGIVDRDRRTQREIDALKGHEIYCLEVAEIENLYCAGGVISEVCSLLRRDPMDVDATKSAIFERLKLEVDKQISLHCLAEVNHALNQLPGSAVGELKIAEELQVLVSGINVTEIYGRISRDFAEIIAQKDYGKLLRIYNRKSLISTVELTLGLRAGEFVPLVHRMLKEQGNNSLAAAFFNSFGEAKTAIEAIRLSR